jgi:hypothetical protein
VALQYVVLKEKVGNGTTVVGIKKKALYVERAIAARLLSYAMRENSLMYYVMTHYCPVKLFHAHHNLLKIN